MIKENLNDDELEEYAVFMSKTVIPWLMQFADKYNIGRDSMVKYFADTMKAVVSCATFRNWEVEKKNE